jgi:hypothetical protein
LGAGTHSYQPLATVGAGIRKARNAGAYAGVGRT